MKLLLPLLLTFLTVVACVAVPQGLPPPPATTFEPSPSIKPIPAYSNNPPPGTQKPIEISATIAPKKRTFNIFFVNNGTAYEFQWQRALNESILEWNNSLEYEVFHPSEVKNANLKVTYEDHREYNASGALVAGKYYGHCLDGEIKFFKDIRSKKTTALHELGHAIGLKHSLIAEDVMFATSGPFKYLTANDIERAKKAVLLECK